MTNKIYRLMYNERPEDGHYNFVKNFKANFLEKANDLIKCTISDGNKIEEDSPEDINIYDIENVCVNIYKGYRNTLINNEIHWWNLRMIGTEENIKKVEGDIKGKGFELEEIV